MEICDTCGGNCGQCGSSHSGVASMTKLVDALNKAAKPISDFVRTPVEGEIYVVGYNKRHERVSVGSRTSFDVHGDITLMTKAIEFDGASKRDGRIFVCALVPRWKRPFLRMLGIRVDR